MCSLPGSYNRLSPLDYHNCRPEKEISLGQSQKLVDQGKGNKESIPTATGPTTFLLGRSNVWRLFLQKNSRCFTCPTKPPELQNQQRPRLTRGSSILGISSLKPLRRISPEALHLNSGQTQPLVTAVRSSRIIGQ